MTPRSDRIRRNNVRELGRGTAPLLFAHGFGCDQNMWKAVAPAFADTHRVVLFDHVGAGGSDVGAYDPGRYADLRGYAEDVVGICEALDLRDVIFVGHSVSAMIGMLAAIGRPDLFARLVMIGPSPCYLNSGDYRGGFDAGALEELLDLMDSNFLGWSSAVAPLIMGNPDRPELAAGLGESFCRTDPDVARHFARVTFFSDNRADLHRLRTPSLLMQCADDAIAPDCVGAYLRDHLAGSHLVRLGATGHCPHVSHPDEVVAVMRGWLGGAGTARHAA